jgi:hypothetical protein
MGVVFLTLKVEFDVSLDLYIGEAILGYDFPGE